MANLISGKSRNADAIAIAEPTEALRKLAESLEMVLTSFDEGKTRRDQSVVALGSARNELAALGREHDRVSLPFASASTIANSERKWADLRERELRAAESVRREQKQLETLAAEVHQRRKLFFQVLCNELGEVTKARTADFEQAAMHVMSNLHLVCALNRITETGRVDVIVRILHPLSETDLGMAPPAVDVGRMIKPWSPFRGLLRRAQDAQRDQPLPNVAA